MTAVLAVDLPRIRDELLEFAATPFAAQLRQFYAEHQGVDVNGELGRVMSAPAPGLAEAMLLYADEALCQVATAAAETLPQFTLDHDDPPAPAGLLWFAEPVRDVDSADEQRPFFAVAVGWTVQADLLWIAPHVKGPEGAPLLGGEKVYVVPGGDDPDGQGKQ